MRTSNAEPRRAALAVFAGTALVLLLAACSSDGSDGGAAGDPSTTLAATTTTEVPSFVVDGEHEVDPNFRQGLARSGDEWIFITDQTLYRADADLAKVEERPDALPAELATQGYDHMGDGDVAAVDGLLWVPVERPDKDSGVQVTARFDPDTFEYVDSFEVAQHHNAFVTVDEDGVAYSADEFSDDTIVRYRVTDGEVEQLEPLSMSTTVDRIQGGDVAGGALWLSTDDDRNGVYRVDLDTGEVTDVGSAGRVAGEGEGIDAEDGAPATLRVLVADEKGVPMWVVELRPQT